MLKSGGKWGKVIKSCEKWLNWEKVAKSGEQWRTVAKSCGKVAKSGKKWRNLRKVGESD